MTIEILVIDNYAVPLPHRREEKYPEENPMYAMFAFDELFTEAHARLAGHERGEWGLIVLDKLSEYYGVEKQTILRDWADYNRPIESVLAELLNHD